MSPKGSEPEATDWRWIEGEVDPTAESIAIVYGSMDDHNRDNWLTVAYIAPPKDHIFTVRFLVTAADAATAKLLEKVKRQIDFYLVEKEEPDPWGYAKYHCGSTANIYSDCHWLYNKGKQDDISQNVQNRR